MATATLPRTHAGSQPSQRSIGGANRIRPAVAVAESWKPRSNARAGSQASSTAAASASPTMASDWRPSPWAASAKVAIVAARSAEGGAPTSRVYSQTPTMANTLAGSRPTTPAPTQISVPATIATFAPETAVRCEVPVADIASRSSGGRPTLAPKTMPATRDACGSGRTARVFASKTPRTAVSRPTRLEPARSTTRAPPASTTHRICRRARISPSGQPGRDRGLESLPRVSIRSPYAALRKEARRSTRGRGSPSGIGAPSGPAMASTSTTASKRLPRGSGASASPTGEHNLAGVRSKGVRRRDVVGPLRVGPVRAGTPPAPAPGAAGALLEPVWLLRSWQPRRPAAPVPVSESSAPSAMPAHQPAASTSTALPTSDTPSRPSCHKHDLPSQRHIVRSRRR